LILRKISKLDATRCQILKLKCTKFVFSWGSQTPLGELTAVYKEATFKWREEKKGRGRGRGGKGEGKGRKERGQAAATYRMTLAHARYATIFYTGSCSNC